MQVILLSTLNVLIYFIVSASIVMLGRKFLPLPKEVIRKSLHFILLGSFVVFILSYKTWQATALAAIIFEVLMFPMLAFLERFSKYSEISTERKPGELKQSLMLVYTMFAIVVAICWGGFGDKFLAICSLYAWGIGDAYAALVGKKYGTHKIEAKGVDGKKSYEGTFAMYVVSCVTVFSILMVRGGLSIVACVIIALVVGSVSATAELYSKDGNDTVICPLSAMTALLPLVYLFGGM